MDRALADLIRISRRVGRDSSLVLGGGGNTSVKTADGRYMYIKASGTPIKEIAEDRGWRRLNVRSVAAIIRDPAMARLPEAAREQKIRDWLRLCCEDEVAGEARPSVESHLHALLGRCVVHLHPLVVSAYVCAKRGEAALGELFGGERHPPLWVPYADPGYMLAAKAERLIGEYQKRHGRKPSLLFLEKHGVFASAESASGVLALVRKAIAACRGRLKPLPTARAKVPSEAEATAAKLCVRRAILQATGEYVSVAHFMDAEIAGLLARRDARELCALAPLTPEEIVYANGSPVWLDRCDAEAIARRLKRQMEAGEKPARSFLIRDLGLIAVGPAKALWLARDIAVGSLLTRAYAKQFGGASPLNQRQRQFIAEWEAESYRQQLVSGRVEGELKERIAMVTGAGSGLGRAIAVGLAKEGALVALADIDEKAAQGTAELIARQSPLPGLVVRCDVTSEQQVEAAFRRVLSEWGGLDILVNAAGIAPPYALVDLPAEKWRAALEINLTGYFLMARGAARVMIEQGIGGCIINLSSKSGLEASRNNTPYNATKAAEIHMARGWALELGQHGIRVNSVAPGNVFEGSKIWNPEYIRMCARKYGIRPQEVIPYYINLTALKRNITGQDVANGVVFLCSEKARTITGQTLVVDSGQVMVR